MTTITAAKVKLRLDYIDIAKGILILMVIYNHTANLATASGVENEIINFIPNTKFFHPFFMPAFFVITGLCSNYNRGFKSFIISNAKALLIPAVSLLFLRMIVRYILTGQFSGLEWSGLTSKSFFVNLGYWNWFLTALFTTKLMFWFIANKIRQGGGRMAIYLFMHILGVVLFNVKRDSLVYYNFYFYQHALMFLIYIGIGYEISKGKLKRGSGILHIVLFSICYIFYLLSERELPRITSDPILPITDIIPHLIMSISGSLAIIYISELIKTNNILADFGRNSLVIYCLHFQFMFSFYEIFKDSLNDIDTHFTITALCILYLFTAFGCLWCSKLLHTKYLRWILGKF